MPTLNTDLVSMFPYDLAWGYGVHYTYRVFSKINNSSAMFLKYNANPWGLPP